MAFPPRFAPALSLVFCAGVFAACAHPDAAVETPPPSSSPDHAAGAPVFASIVSGDVKLVTPTGRTTKLAQGQMFPEGNTVVVGRDAAVLLVFSNGLALRLLPNSMLEIVRYRPLANPPPSADAARADQSARFGDTVVYLKAGTAQGEGKLFQPRADLPLTVVSVAGAAAIRGDFSLTVQRNASGRFTGAIVNCLLGGLDFSPRVAAPMDYSAAAPVAFIRVEDAGIAVSAGGQLQVRPVPTAGGQVGRVDVAGAGLDRAEARKLTTDFYATIFATITDHSFVATLPPPPQPAPPPGVPEVGMVPPAPDSPPLP